MRTPRVLRKVKVDGKWVLLPVARMGDASGAVLDFSRVLLHKVAIEPVEAGAFFLEYRDAGRKERRSVGMHPRDAKAAMLTQASVLELRKKGVKVDDAPELAPRVAPVGKSIDQVVREFIAVPPPRLRPRSVAKYSNALESFQLWARRVRKTHLGQLGRDDMLAFMADGTGRLELDVSTAKSKTVIAMNVLTQAGAVIEMRRGDWPIVTRVDPEVYEAETLKKLFAVMSPYDVAVYRTFLMTGMREQEVAFLSWPDFNPGRSTLRVSEKPHLGFRLKNYQERTVPIPKLLVETLEEHRSRQQKIGDWGGFLMFPTRPVKGTSGGSRDRKRLDKLKRLAKLAGLNCGQCEAEYHNRPVTCQTHPVCQQFGLHKFRHTYATTLLRDGVDLVSLRKLLGHKDLDSTKVYLRALDPEGLLVKINQTSLGSRFQ